MASELSVPQFDWACLTHVSSAQPLRILFSACLLGHATGWEGTPYPEALTQRIAKLPQVKACFFCPEDVVLGTPRPLTTLYEGHGDDFWAGQARVLDTTGRDVSEALKTGAQAMLRLARQQEVQLAILLDVSDSCGSHVVYLGAPDERRYQQGRGVAAALLMHSGIPVIAQRDTASLQRILQALDPDFKPDPDAFDFVDHPWYVDYFQAGPVGLPLAEYERQLPMRP